ncbi:inositol-trisphosphate 3-kinase B [Platysternon megacephalum]|uniref:Inositol-trisphosphate 3-kinase B n=1 Tax=Platysternon megacephalum TaxID=55544 RepID=A0A4D9ET80_9SAUR|nr:inositol-trisphosphate 3-kinase B [Platysternon megacephalum]
MAEGKQGSLVKQSEFDDFLKAAGSKLVVVDFSAKWCGPCKAIDPVIHDLAVRYDSVMFCSVDIDLAEDVANSCKIIAMPTFQMYKETEKEEFTSELKAACEKLVVVDFSATWCGPCKMIKPFYHSLSEKFPDVVFLEVDVDDAQDVASECAVQCMPTFHFYKQGKKVHEFSGANREKLEESITKLR